MGMQAYYSRNTQRQWGRYIWRSAKNILFKDNYFRIHIEILELEGLHCEQQQNARFQVYSQGIQRTQGKIKMYTS